MTYTLELIGCFTFGIQIMLLRESDMSFLEICILGSNVIEKSRKGFVIKKSTV